MYEKTAIIFILVSTLTYTSASWLKHSKLMAWQLNPQLYLLGAMPKCTTAKFKLSPLQNVMCTNGGYMDHMSSVNVGLLIALNECRHQFSPNKWNCSTVQLESILEGAKGIEATKEDAFLHAASAAGIAHAVARGCRNGLISKCSCSEMDRPKSLDKDWVWGGCGDNVIYGYNFATAFVDLREKESNHPKGSEELAQMLLNKHNNEAGRRMVLKGDIVSCKCHGVSGSCTLKTCWQELSPFRKIGDKMKANYISAMQVAFNKAGTGLRNKIRTRRSKRRASKEELIYIAPLPDICNTAAIDNTTISMTGRTCSTVSAGEDNCNRLCCGRGYEKKIITTSEKCNCKFQWCCFVQCDQCLKQVEKYICL